MHKIWEESISQQERITWRRHWCRLWTTAVLRKCVQGLNTERHVTLCFIPQLRGKKLKMCEMSIFTFSLLQSWSYFNKPWNHITERSLVYGRQASRLVQKARKQKKHAAAKKLRNLTMWPGIEGLCCRDDGESGNRCEGKHLVDSSRMAGLWSSRKVHVLEEMSGGWREGQKKEVCRGLWGDISRWQTGQKTKD